MCAFAAMRLIVKSRYTNIHGGYEEGPAHDGFPAFRRSAGGTWIFHKAAGGAGPRWHFGPSLPSSAASHAAAFFTSLAEAAAPESAPWPEAYVDNIRKPAASKEYVDNETTLFVDRDFMPNARSLGDLPKLPPMEWVSVRRLRAGEMHLFNGGISPNDLLQGAIGNCWLVAAMASLAEFPEVVEGLFASKELSPDGRCEVRLYDKHCAPLMLVIDEFIPCHKREWWDEEGMPLFARPNGNEAWVLLVEKAFAKMMGSYKELNGGNCCTAFRAFTGERDTFVWARGEGEAARVHGDWKRMELADGETHFEFNPDNAERRDSDGIWKEVQRYDQGSYLVACSMRAHHGMEHVRVDGLVEAHAYSLLRAVEVQGHRLIFLRNPWGNDKRWNGRWCDGDEAWVRNPGVRRRLRPEFCDDGAFWMAWGDFQASFDFIFVSARSMRSGMDKTEHARQSQEAEVPAAPPRTNPRRRLAAALPERLPIMKPGTRVEMLPGRRDRGLAGRIVEVVKWDETNEVYEVQDVPTPYWTCTACGEVNKRRREKCNVCNGLRDTHTPRPRSYQTRPEEVILPPGTEVQVDGLRGFPELNGQSGTVLAFDRQSGRYHIELPDGGVRAVRPPHLVARRGPAQETEYGRWVPPVPEPSHVDEPEEPEEVPCENEDELEKFTQKLDENCRLLEDLEHAGRRLRRGQELLREGALRGRSVAELRRRGAVPMPIRLRFVRFSPALVRFGPAGAYVHAILRLDEVVAEIIRAEEQRRKPRPGQVSFFGISVPDWQPATPKPAPVPVPPTEAKRAGERGRLIPGSGSRRGLDDRIASAGAAGAWKCPDCGHTNAGIVDICANCEDEDDGEVLSTVIVTKSKKQ